MMLDAALQAKLLRVERRELDLLDFARSFLFGRQFTEKLRNRYILMRPRVFGAKREREEVHDEPENAYQGREKSS